VQHEYNVDAHDEERARRFMHKEPVKENKYAGALLAESVKAEREEIENYNK
jgi:hypothetical protein